MSIKDETSESIVIVTGASSGLGVCYVDAVTKLFPDIDELWLIARREGRLKKWPHDIFSTHSVGQGGRFGLIIGTLHFLFTSSLS